MLRLQTFGTVNLSRNGEVLSGAAQQRRLLATLAVLAAAGQAGTSRDRLLALFWPESEPDKARRALNQSLYHIRKELGEEALFLGSAELRLNPEFISSDVGDFERLIAAGSLADAVALYSGPFLDAFYITGVAEFEEWTASARARYAARHLAALDSLATAAKADGDLASEAKWRRLRVAADPLEGVAVVRLMECLIAQGLRAEALAAAQSHEERMRLTLELPADAAVVALAKSIRVTPVGTPQLAGMSLPRESTSSATPSIPVPPTVIVQAAPRPKRHPMRWAVAASVVLITSYFVIANHLRQDRATRDGSMLIVTPFRMVGQSGPDKAYVAEGLLDMLSTRLAAADTKRPADASVVLTAWRTAGLDGAHVPTIAEVSGVARSLGGREVVTGSVTGNGKLISVSAEMLDANQQAVTSEVSVQGSADSLGSLVDRVVTGLVLGAAGESDRIRTPPTLSPAALRTYMQGHVAYRRGDFQQAIRFFSQAVANDPTFALAGLDLALAADRVSAAEQYDRGLALAWAGRAALSQRDSAYLVAFAGSRYPAPSPATDHLAAWQRVVQLDPTHADSWYGLAQAYFYDGKALGINDATDRAEKAVRQSLAVDSTFTPATRLLPVILISRRDVAGLRKLLRTPGTLTRWGDLRVYLTWRIALVLGDQAALRGARAEFATAPLASLRAIALASQIDGVSIGDGDRALVLLRQKAVTDREILDALLAMHSRAVNAGDVRRVNLVMAELRKTEPAFHVDARLRVLDALYGGGDRAAAVLAAGELSGHFAAEDGSTPADSAVRVADACVLAQWHLDQKDTVAVRGELRFLRSAGAPTFPVPVGANPMACADIIDAAIAPADLRRARVAHADSLMLSGPAVGAGLRQANLILARIFESEGQSELALATLRRWQYPRWWPRYHNTIVREEARLALALGDTGTARWARYQAALLAVPIVDTPHLSIADRAAALGHRFGIR